MQSASTFFALAVVASLCSADPQYEYQPFTGYHYPEALPVVDPGHGYFYDAPLPLFQPSQYPYEQLSRSAICVLTNTSTSTVNGEVRLFQGSHSEPVVISGLVSNLSPGLHGFHVHNEGKLGNDCKDAGSHFNPDNSTHGAPEDKVRHHGDLGNIEALSDGNAHFAILSDRLSLSPGHSGYTVGRAIVVHEKLDDLGKGGDEESLKTGNAGARVACCVIRPLHY